MDDRNEIERQLRPVRYGEADGMEDWRWRWKRIEDGKDLDVSLRGREKTSASCLQSQKGAELVLCSPFPFSPANFEGPALNPTQCSLAHSRLELFKLSACRSANRTLTLISPRA